MLNRLLNAVAAVALIGCLSSAADAGLVTLNELQNQTSFGQGFTFTFSPVMLSDGITDATFTLHARGDYGTDSFETLTWDIEGIVSGGPVGGFDSGGTGGVGGPFESITELFENNSYEFTRIYTISAANMAAIAADNSVTISVDLAPDVDVLLIPGVIPQPFVEVTLEYEMQPIPEPTSLALLGMGVAGLGGYRWRRKRQFVA